MKKTFNKFNIIASGWLILFTVIIILAVFRIGSDGVAVFLILGFPIILILFFIPLAIFLNKSDLTIEGFVSFLKKRFKYILMGSVQISLGLDILRNGWIWPFDNTYIPEETGYILVFSGIVFLIFCLLKKAETT